MPRPVPVVVIKCINRALKGFGFHAGTVMQELRIG